MRYHGRVLFSTGSQLTISTVHGGFTGSFGTSLWSFFFLWAEVAALSDNFELLLLDDLADETTLSVSSAQRAIFMKPYNYKTSNIVTLQCRSIDVCRY